MLRDHPVNDPVVLCLFRGHEVIALRIGADLVVVLLRVLGDDLVETSADIDDLFSVNLDICRLTLETARNLVDQDLRVGQRMRLPSAPPASSSAPIDIAMPTQIVCTSG